MIPSDFFISGSERTKRLVMLCFSINSSAEIAKVLIKTHFVFLLIMNSAVLLKILLPVAGAALAISLLEKRNFSSENFKKFHPGGQLGSKMQTVKDLMHKGREMPLIESNKKMGSMLILMTEKRLGCVGIVNQKKSLIGVVTDGDLRRNMNKNLLEKKIADIMTKKPKVISQEKLAVEALNLMNKHKITQLFVTNRSIPMGVIHIHDLYRVGIK